MACELVRSGRIGKVKTVNVNVGAPSKPCDLPEEKMEAGPRLGPLAGAGAEARLQFGPQPARRPRPFPRLAACTANTPAA